MEHDFSKLTNVFNAMFNNPSDYKYMPNEIKETNFFIILRYFSKKFPLQADKLNRKFLQNKVAGMDLLHYFIRQQVARDRGNTPQFWFWSKSPYVKTIEKLSDEDNLIYVDNEFNSIEEFNDFKRVYKKEYEEELEYAKYQIKLSKKSNKK